MKQLAALTFCLTIGLVLAFHLACSQSSYPSSSYNMAPTTTPTFTNTPVFTNTPCTSCTPTFTGTFTFTSTVTNTPTPTYTPTFTMTPCTSCTPTPVHIYYNGSLRYSLTPTSGVAISQPVTVAVNQQVVFDSSLSGHPLYIDTGSTCSVNNNTSFPFTFTPSSAADYIAHCGLHGACSGGNTNCPTSGCAGMAFTLHAQ